MQTPKIHYAGCRESKYGTHNLILLAVRMHGSYTHRVTCNMYPVQHYTLMRAAERLKTPLAPFVRDAALAYVEQKLLLPPELSERLQSVQQEIRHVGSSLSQITTRASAIQRLTHTDLRSAAKLVTSLENQVAVLRSTLETLPNARQINGS